MSDSPALSLRPGAGSVPDRQSAVSRRIGLLNGALIGLALALGVYGVQAVRLAGMPVTLQFPSLIVAALLLIGLFALAGLLSARSERAGVVALIWLAAGIAATFLISFQPTVGRTLLVWLADPRFRGLPIYPHNITTPIAPILAGFFIILVLVILALLQTDRLDAVRLEIDHRGRLERRAWLLLLAPLPLVFLAGVITQSIARDPSAQALSMVHQAVQRGRTYDGDLFALGLEEGLNYSAIQGVRDQMSRTYRLSLGGVDPAAAVTYVVAHFDNGAWVVCRIIGESLSFCYDAAPPYTIGLTSLITGEALPESCRGCLPRVSDELAARLLAQGERFAGPPQVTLLAQWGGYTLMRAEAGDHALECWFTGISPVILDSCREARP